MFDSPSQFNNDVHASYNISSLIARSGKPHTTEVELILPGVLRFGAVLLKSPE